MQDDKVLLLLFGVLVGLLSLGYIVWLFATKTVRRLSAAVVGLAVTPSLILMFLIASLAVHMRLSLGGWPLQIGEEGFSPGLIFHAETTIYYFIFLLYLTLFLMPVAAVTCALISAWRGALNYLAISYVAYCCNWVLLLIMPDGFLYWWWD